MIRLNEVNSFLVNGIKSNHDFNQACDLIDDVVLVTSNNEKRKFIDLLGLIHNYETKNPPTNDVCDID